MLRVVLFLFLMGWCGTLTAGARKDYEGCDGNCDTRLESVSQHSLEGSICYETTAFSVEALRKTHVEPVSMVYREHQLEDLRIKQLRLFFARHHAPVAKHAELFIRVADENGLDWRLLPTFAYIESGGGRHHRFNNIFGWDSGRKHFANIEAGIRYVARALTLGPYKGLTTLQKIRVYNHRRRYFNVVVKILSTEFKT